MKSLMQCFADTKYPVCYLTWISLFLIKTIKRLFSSKMHVKAFFLKLFKLIMNIRN